MKNVAADAAYADALQRLRRETDEWMKRTNDPRAGAGAGVDAFDQYPYFGGGPDNAMESRPRGQRRGARQQPAK